MKGKSIMHEKKTQSWLHAISKTVGAISMSQRQISWVIAAVLVVNAVSFLTGYLWGKKRMAEQACYAITRDSLADTVYSAVCCNNGQLNDVADEQDVDSAVSSDLDSEGEIASVATETENEEVVACERKSESEDLESTAEYFAQLVSFHTLTQANRFANKLRANAVPVNVKERSSKTARGKVIKWFQIVAGPYDSRERVTQVAAQLQKSEKLHDVRIVQG